MTDQTLAEIVAVEKDIQAQLAEEQRRAAAWLAKEREEIGRTGEEQVSAARREFRHRLTTAETEADTEVGDLLRRAELYAARLHEIPEEELRLLVRRHLTRLLPERAA